MIVMEKIETFLRIGAEMVVIGIDRGAAVMTGKGVIVVGKDPGRGLGLGLSPDLSARGARVTEVIRWIGRKGERRLVNRWRMVMAI